ncbi:LysR family transcriptional regulator [Pigmentiphaga litoralis]|uniref:LysR family transcriptional regulator n=1 Tax=Pigmentiphaga litoralis TaxID=516702 RepID=UPI003B43AA0D
MEFRHLRYFLAVADAGHITRAAEQLGIQQPPLSQQIKALEQQLGLALFHRHPKGVSLTDGGRLFEAEARRIVNDTEAMQARMALVARGETGRLDVGITSSAGAHAFTPRVLRACRIHVASVALTITERNAAEITEAVADTRLHCGLLRVPVATPAGLSFETLLREPVMVALPADHPLARRTGRRAAQPLSIQDLRDESLILVRKPGAPGLYQNLLALFHEQGLQPRIHAEVERMTTNINLVASGMGVSVVPASMRTLHPEEVIYRPLRESARLDAPITLVYRTADCVGATARFVALCRETARAAAQQ